MRNLLHALALLALAALSAATGVLLVRQARAEYAFRYAGSVEAASGAWELDPTRAEYAKVRGDYWMRLSLPQDLRSAAVEYRAALQLDAWNSTHWMDWGQLCSERSRLPQARRAHAQADRTDPNNQIVQRDVGNFLLAEGDIDAALRHHARAIRFNPAFAAGLWPVYWSLGKPPLALAGELLGNDPALLRTYFSACLDWVEPAAAAALWADFAAREDTLTPQAHQRYFSYLLEHRDFPAARTLWQWIAQAYYRQDWDPAAPSCWNGDLEMPPAFPGGLEWQIPDRDPAGVQIRVSAAPPPEQGRCLWLHFTGEQNLDGPLVRHLLFLDPGTTYSLEYQVSTLNVTTDNGPFVALRIGTDPAVEKRDPVRTGTGKSEQKIVFFASAPVAELRIARDRSPKLNNKIQGDAWFDGFSLAKTAAPGEPPQ